MTLAQRLPAELIDEADRVVASGSCLISESVNQVGMKSWRGQLTNLTPEFGLMPGAYEMRFEDGRSGSVIVDRVNFSTGRRTIATFVGNGSPPSYE